MKLHWPGTWLKTTRHPENSETLDIHIVQRDHRETITMSVRALEVMAKYGYEILVNLRDEEEQGRRAMGEAPRDPDVMTPDPDSGVAQVMKGMARNQGRTG